MTRIKICASDFEFAIQNKVEKTKPFGFSHTTSGIGIQNMHPLSLCMQTNLSLTFHKIPSAYWFKNTMITIKKFFNFISIEDIEAYYYYKKDFNNCCHICFDDGDITFYEYAFPVLKEMRIPATLFVSPKIIQDDGNFWFQELYDMAKQIDEDIDKTNDL